MAGPCGLRRFILSLVVLILNLASCALAFDNDQFSNVVAYWGQNSNGGLNPNDPDAAQKRLSFYCGDDSPVDVFPVAFLNTFVSQGGLPSLDLSNICATYNSPVFPGTLLVNCSFLEPDIRDCQARGKIVTLSLGGASADTDFRSEEHAREFAQLIWDLFLGGSHEFRPFGNAVLDGLDLDLEGGGVTGDIAFVTRIRQLADADKSKKYYVTAAPQCPYPDVNLQGTLNAALFDAVYVQFYNNFCSLPTINTTAFNFGVWDVWAQTISPNRDIKVYLGAPGSRASAGSGYVAIDELKSISQTMRKAFPSFGGVMFWDMSTSYANNRMDAEIKKTLVASGPTGFTYPKCDADGWKAGNYNDGSKVSYEGYIWQANGDVSSTPGIDPPNGEWTPLTACGGDNIPPHSTPTTSKPPAPSSTCANCGPTSTAGTPGLGSKKRPARCVLRSRKKALGEL